VNLNSGEFERYDGDEIRIALPEGTNTVGRDVLICNPSVQMVVIPEGVTKIDILFYLSTDKHLV